LHGGRQATAGVAGWQKPARVGAARAAARYFPLDARGGKGKDHGVNTRTLLFLICGVGLMACEAKQEPAACEGVASIFESEGCLEAVTLDCRAHTDESECWAAPPVEVAQGSVKCRWTHVAVVEDTDTCGFGTRFGRCEASMEIGLAPVFDPCVDGQFTGSGHVVFPAERELVDLAPVPEGATPRGNLIGPWAAIDAAPGVVDSCHEGNDSALCACAAAACEL
jgi:hypothetical protein